MKAATILLVVALAAGLFAWQRQSDAASLFATAESLQEAAPPEDDTPPPSAEVNVRLVDSLEQSLRIRTSIDNLVLQAEDSIRLLQNNQQTSKSSITAARAELSAIARILAGPVGAATATSADLRTLRARLATSAELARLIAQELAELDRNLGP